MKPYFLIGYNFIKLGIKSLLHRNIQFNKIQLFSTNTKIHVSSDSILKLGSRLVSDGRVVLNVGDGGKLEVNDNVYFNEGVMISCKENVKIGKGCLFGPDVKVFDNNHVFDSQKGVTFKHNTAPITIGNNCWIASGVIILKGTTIGNNCVIGAGCVVNGTIPDSSIVTQNRELIIKPIRD